MKPKAAVKVRRECFDVYCPHCQQEQESPQTGSLMWFEEDLATEKTTRACWRCGAEFFLPMAKTRR